MSVYTPVSLQQVQAMASHYGLQVRQIIPIQGGIENTSYFVQLDNHPELVLTIFEQLEISQIDALASLLGFLQQQGLPVAAPLADLNQHTVHYLHYKPAQFSPKLAGQHPVQPVIAQVKQLGRALAQLHLALQHYPLHPLNNHGQDWWQQTKAVLQPQLASGEQQLLQQVFMQFEQAQQQYPQRPGGLIHADLFRDNTLFVGEQLTGLLDFSELSADEWLLDIAICLNDFCSNWPQVQLNPELAQAFIASYHQVRPLTRDERHALPVYLAMAACRFWLSRLQVQQRNQRDQRQGDFILQKDPGQMQAMLRDRLGLNAPFI